MAPALTLPLLLLAALATFVLCAAGLSPRSRFVLLAAAVVTAAATGFVVSSAYLS